MTDDEIVDLCTQLHKENWQLKSDVAILRKSVFDMSKYAARLERENTGSVQKKMSKSKVAPTFVTYDYTVDSIVAIDVPIGTNPNSEEIMELLAKKLMQRIKDKDISFTFDQTFDFENGLYENLEDKVTLRKVIDG